MHYAYTNEIDTVLETDEVLAALNLSNKSKFIMIDYDKFSV